VEWCCHFPLPVHLLPTGATTMSSPTSPAGSGYLSSPCCTATKVSESPATTSSSPPAEAFHVHQETSLLCERFVSHRAALIPLFLLTTHLDLLSLPVPEQPYHTTSRRDDADTGSIRCVCPPSHPAAASSHLGSVAAVVASEITFPGSTWFMWLSPVPFGLPACLQDLLRRDILCTVVVHCGTGHVPAGRDQPNGA
jgi:hypothetical protein